MMNIGDLRRSIEELPDAMELVAVHGDKALHVCGLGTSMLGSAAQFEGSSIAIVSGPRVFEITVRTNA